MTNLEIIKYLATNNPTRLAELLDDIYCTAWNCGSYAGSNGEGKLLEECEIDNFEEWINQDAAKSGFYYNEELEEWSKPINNPSIEITYPDNLAIKLPWEGKDPNHMWNTDNVYEIIDKAIYEMKLLENIIGTDKYSDAIYNAFRRDMCHYCSSKDCLRSKMAIVECSKFKPYYEVQDESNL